MKILIVRVGALGDVIHALPAVGALKRAKPEWQIDWVVDPRWAPLLAAMDSDGRGPFVQRVHLAETKKWSTQPLSLSTAKSVMALRHILKSEHYDAAIDMQGTLRSAVIGSFAKAKIFTGFSDPREKLATAFYRQQLTRRGAHVVEQGSALLGESLNIPLIPGAVEFPRESWAENWAEQLVGGRRMCVLGAGGGWGAKRWPVEKFGELARQLSALGFTVVINAPRKDDVVASQIVAASHGAAETVVCNVTGLIALMRRASLLVGGDTGPTHLAAALGIPLVALFGPTNPARNGPWGQGHKIVLRTPNTVTTYKRTEETEPGLAKISVEQVMETVQSLV